MLRACIEQALTFSVLSHCVDVVAGFDSINDLCPRFPIVVSAEDIWRAVLLQIVLCRNIRGARTMWRGFDQTDARKIGNARWRDLCPVLTLVAGHINQTII